MNKSDIILWLQETIFRFRNTSPKYFKTTGIINMVIAGLGALPDIIQFFEITVPPKWMLVVGKIVFVAGVWGKLNNTFAVAKPLETPLPFTEKKQLEEDIKEKK